MGVLFEECAARRVRTRVHLDRPFDIASESATSYTVPELAALVRRAAGWFAAAGAGPSDRVAVVKPNHWDYDVLACAAVRIGAVPAQLSAQLPRQWLLTLLRRLSPALLVTTRQVWEELGAADALEAAPVTLLLDGRAPDADGRAPGVLGLDDVADAPAPPPYRRHDDEPLVVNHTSGTTGVPKLVAHSTRTLVGKLARFETVRYPRIGVRRDDTLVNASSYAHGRTFCWTASALCLDPAEIAIVTGQDPDLADPVLRAHPPTVMEALPASYVRFEPLTRRLDNPFRRVRLFISTYDAVHPPTVRAYLRASARRSPLWMQGWGQTETGPLTFRFHTRRSAADDAVAGGSRDVGRPVPGKTRLRVVDPDTFRPLPRGQAGLVLARTAALAAGYVGESDRWAAKQLGAWWNTGDLGLRRGDGTVELLDREVDRTPLLSCLRAEDLLEDRLPQIAECVLLNPPGRPPLPVVVTQDGVLDRAAWDLAVRDLPPLGEPVALTWDEVPRTGTGKVRRTALLRQLTGSARTAGSGRWT
ncbi:acyl--CoA ligase [Streptomyces albus subsp. chlorinus]|uniref:AMP-binding protein n=1 Tax=Streptomyces albus TaxID=1888 RepID=UPI00156ECCEC|nr:AMP-binding protein [Streptomyces albus]NSC24370.1 acyl--CoA ligase [Streptomyces albus subsp. chlorinus]